MVSSFSWWVIFSVLLAATEAGRLPNSINNSTTTTSNLTDHDLPILHTNTNTAAIIRNSSCCNLTDHLQVIEVNNSTTTNILLPPPPATLTSTTTVYMDVKPDLLTVLVPSLISFSGMVLMVLLYWWSWKAKLVDKTSPNHGTPTAADQRPLPPPPPIASLVADPTSSFAIAPAVELINQSIQQQNHPPPTRGGSNEEIC